jgi:hypothetical protein
MSAAPRCNRSQARRRVQWCNESVILVQRGVTVVFLCAFLSEVALYSRCQVLGQSSCENYKAHPICSPHDA